MGLIYLPDGSLPWARSHAMLPTPLDLGDGRLRIYVASLDDDGVGRIGYVDVDISDPSRVLAVAAEPVLDVGQPGAFDDNGVNPCSVVRWGDEVRLYYIGYQLAVHVRYLLFSGLVRSHCEARLRVGPLAMALIAAVFLRYDSVFLALPIALTGIAVHGLTEAFKRGLVLALIVAIPLGIWWGRSVAAGLDTFPKPYGGAPPMGYISWGKTWAVDQYQGPSWAYVITTKYYDHIDIDPKIYRNDDERRRVESLVAELKGHTKKPFPPHIDAAFAEIAAERRAAEPWRYWVVLPLKRAAALWFSPRNSAAWPVSLRLAPTETAANWSRLVEITLANPGSALVKLGTAAYRLVLPLAALALLALAWRKRWRLEVWLLANALTLALARTLFMAAMLLTEPRYVVETMPFLELAAVAALARLGMAAKGLRQNG